MVNAQHAHEGGNDEHNRHPGRGHAKLLDQHSSKVDQPARGGNLRDVVERPLPSNPSGLLLFRQNAHVSAVRGDVMGCPTQRDNGQNGDGHGKEVGQVECECHQGEAHTRHQLRKDDEELLRLIHFQKRAPQWFQRPWQHDERRPEGNLRVAHAHALVHERADHVENHEWHAHGKVQRGHPCHWADPTSRCLLTGHGRSFLAVPNFDGFGPMVNSSSPPPIMSLYNM